MTDVMTTKAAILEAISQLPEEVSYDDVLEVIAVRRNVDQGLKELDAGLGVPHEEFLKRNERWFQ